MTAHCRVLFFLPLAPFAQINVGLARMVSGDSRAGEWIERLQQDTSMLIADGPDRFHFQPFFQQFIQWELEQEFSDEERRNVFRQAGLYYELQNQLRPALDCYTKIGEHSKLSALLIKNAQLHPGIALPHRDISGLTELIPTVFGLITSKQIKRHSLSVTS